MLRSLSLSPLLFALAVAPIVACGGSNAGSSGFPGTTGGGSGGSSGGSGSGSGGSGSGSGGTLGGSGSGSGGGSTSGCSDAAKLVYVLSEQNDLYSFDPPNKKFTKIGPLGCQTQMTPNSMAVARDGTAWVNYVKAGNNGNYTAGAIFKVSTADASCAPQSLPLAAPWFHLGMGYSTDGATSTNETLFIAATGTGAGLASFDTTSGKVTPLGTFSGSLANKDAELTGTGDGRLFGFFVPDPTTPSLDPVSIAEITKTNGATSTPVTMTGVTPPSAWAFSFWGGDFYLYTWSVDPNGSDVTHYSPATGAIDTSYMTGVGFTIVGAGVSTCAPTTPPK